MSRSIKVPDSREVKVNQVRDWALNEDLNAFVVPESRALIDLDWSQEPWIVPNSLKRPVCARQWMSKYLLEF